MDPFERFAHVCMTVIVQNSHFRHILRADRNLDLFTAASMANILLKFDFSI